MTPRLESQLVRYLGVGALSTSADFLSYLALTRLGLLGDRVVSAGALSYLAGGAVSFALNRSWTFGSHSTKIGRQYLVFLVVNLAGLGLHALVLAGLVRLGAWDVAAKAAAILIVLFPVYLTHRSLTFRRQAEPDGHQDA